MALTINAPLEAKGGLSIPAGSHLEYMVMVSDAPTHVHFITKLYMNKAARDARENPIQAKVIDSNINVPLTHPLVELLNCTVVGDIAILLDKTLQSVLEQKEEIGDGNTEIVSR